MKFFCDRMLGKLARKLRILGFDTLYYPQISEEKVLELSKGRILLTRDKELFRRASGMGRKVVFIESDDWKGQILQLTLVLPIEEEMEPFSRCVECNTPLIQAKPEDVKNRVPEYVFKTVDEFKTCPRCGKVYWRGTHIDWMDRDLGRLVGGWRRTG